jgi:hypothetical protein
MEARVNFMIVVDDKNKNTNTTYTTPTQLRPTTDRTNVREERRIHTP